MNKERAILLASGTSTKIKVLEDADIMYVAAMPDVDESLLRLSADEHSQEEMESFIKGLARIKAESVHDAYLKYKSGIPIHDFDVIGKSGTYRSDVELSLLVATHTIYYRDGVIYDKPRSPSQARDMLQANRGLMGEFITGHCYIGLEDGMLKEDIVSTAFRMTNIDDYMIEAYINTEEPYQSAAGLMIRRGSFLIGTVMGDLHNIYGLSLTSLGYAMRDVGTNLHQYWKV